MWRKKGHLKVAEKNRKWRKKILELAGDQSQNMVTMLSWFLAGHFGQMAVSFNDKLRPE